MNTTVIAGSRPIGSCAPDGSHVWATRSFADGRYLFTVYNGWLITSETNTDDLDLAALIEKGLREWL